MIKHLFRIWCWMTDRRDDDLHAMVRFRKEFGVDLPIDGDHL